MMKKDRSIRSVVDEIMVWWIYIACLLVGPASLFLCPPLVTISILVSAMVCMFVAPFGGFIGIPMFVVALSQIAIAVKELST